MLNFSWATDLDPKGANNHIKDAIDRRYVTDDDDEDPSIDSSVCKFQVFIYIFVAKSFTVLYCGVLCCKDTNRDWLTPIEFVSFIFHYNKQRNSLLEEKNP